MHKAPGTLSLSEPSQPRKFVRAIFFAEVIPKRNDPSKCPDIKATEYAGAGGKGYDE
jgi:hypothetical protein